MKFHCEEGGKKKAKCDGLCIQNQVICIHLVMEMEIYANEGK